MSFFMISLYPYLNCILDNIYFSLIEIGDALPRDLTGGHAFQTLTAHLVTVAGFGPSRDAANAVRIHIAQTRTRSSV